MAFVVESGKARLMQVEIGHSNGVAAEVKGGLSEGQQVILHPPDTIVDGGRVTPRRPES